MSTDVSKERHKKLKVQVYTKRETRLYPPNAFHPDFPSKLRDYVQRTKLYKVETGQTRHTADSITTTFEGVRRGVHLNFVPHLVVTIVFSRTSGWTVGIHTWGRVRKVGVAAAVVTQGLTALLAAGTFTAYIHQVKDHLALLWAFIEDNARVAGMVVERFEQQFGETVPSQLPQRASMVPSPPQTAIPANIASVERALSEVEHIINDLSNLQLIAFTSNMPDPSSQEDPRGPDTARTELLAAINSLSLSAERCAECALNRPSSTTSPSDSVGRYALDTSRLLLDSMRSTKAIASAWLRYGVEYADFHRGYSSFQRIIGSGKEVAQALRACLRPILHIEQQRPSYGQLSAISGRDQAELGWGKSYLSESVRTLISTAVPPDFGQLRERSNLEAVTVQPVVESPPDLPPLPPPAPAFSELSPQQEGFVNGIVHPPAEAPPAPPDTHNLLRTARMVAEATRDMVATRERPAEAAV